MKLILPMLLLASLLMTACQNPDKTKAQPASETEVAAGYDSLLALKLGADQWGMSQYVIAFLKAGPNRPAHPDSAARLQKAHMENISRMASEGKLLLAGPFLDGGELRGIYLFDVKTIEEARTLTETDPAVQAGSLIMELHPWYGSAALREVNAIHNRISQPVPATSNQ